MEDLLWFVLLVEEMRRRAIDEGKTVLVIRKGKSNGKRHN